MIKYFSIKLFSMESRSRELLQDWKVTSTMSGLNTDHDNVLRVDVGEDALVGKPGLKAFSNFMYGSSVSSI